MEGINKYLINRTSSKREIICYLLREFYRLGWCTGTGGGISIKDSDTSVLIAPSGVHKEFVEAEDLFEMDLNGNVLKAPENPKLRCSECTPLFLQAYKLRNAGAVLHSHSISALLITNLYEREFHCKNLEMIKGIQGHKNTDWARIPIINNTENEAELTESLKNAIIAYPRSYAVLVKNHGVYVWGPTWEKAKVHVECYEYLFKAILKMHKYPQMQNNIYHDSNIPDPLIRSWEINEENVEDLRNELQHRDAKWLSKKQLEEIGILLWKLDGNRDNKTLDEICVQRNYKNRDEKEISPNLKSYEEMLKTFATEHLHADEEIRYVLKGSGYFDVRDKNDTWIRIHVTKGDLIILPEGIYHRYCQDKSEYIQVMRIFQDEPKWIAHNRPNDDHPSRLKYKEKF
jgi:methylthioribulose-1-phosphate dehydratase